MRRVLVPSSPLPGIQDLAASLHLRALHTSLATSPCPVSSEDDNSSSVLLHPLSYPSALPALLYCTPTSFTSLLQDLRCSRGRTSHEMEHSSPTTTGALPWQVLVVDTVSPICLAASIHAFGHQTPRIRQDNFNASNGFQGQGHIELKKHFYLRSPIIFCVLMLLLTSYSK